jgi:hypothetical protein
VVTEIDALLGALARDDAAGWSVGTWGAVADLERAPGDGAIVERDAAGWTWRTTLGGVRVSAVPALRVVAYERCLRPAGSWRQALGLCLPDAQAACARRGVVTELGPDAEALDPDDRSAILFDLGLGARAADFCVRTADPATLAALRAAARRPLFDPSHGLAARLVALSPARVVITAAGRAEIATSIPPPGGTTPRGPHTHLLPKLLATGRTHPAIEPIPAGWIPVATVFPPHPLIGTGGTPIPFDADRHERFQALLHTYGDPAHLATKATISAAVLTDAPAARPTPGPGRTARSRAARVTLRQLAHTAPTAPGLPAWREAFGEPSLTARPAAAARRAATSTTRSPPPEQAARTRPR